MSSDNLFNHMVGLFQTENKDLQKNIRTGYNWKRLWNESTKKNSLWLKAKIIK
jgi:hypothetical protein